MPRVIEKYDFSDMENADDFATLLNNNPFFWSNYQNLAAVMPITARKSSVIVEFMFDDNVSKKLNAVRLMAVKCNVMYYD